MEDRRCAIDQAIPSTLVCVTGRRRKGMPPPNLSQQDSLALAQDKALAQSGINPFEPSPASAFLEVCHGDMGCGYGI